jgi:hypothetical protein
LDSGSSLRQRILSIIIFLMASLVHLSAWLLSFITFLLILLAMWFGIAYRASQSRRDKDNLPVALGSLQSSVLTLMALLLGFTFGMALTKFENRRKTILQEANSIATAILRTDLYPDSVRSLLRSDFSAYIDARIDYYSAGMDDDRMQRSLQDASKYSRQIWGRVIEMSRRPDGLMRTNQMIPAMNAVIDIVTARDADRAAKIPPVVMLALLILILTGSFLVGYDQAVAKRRKIFFVGFAFMTTIAVYLILELERPRSGLINLEDTEKYIVELKRMVN